MVGSDKGGTDKWMGWPGVPSSGQRALPSVRSTFKKSLLHEINLQGQSCRQTNGCMPSGFITCKMGKGKYTHSKAGHQQVS